MEYARQFCRPIRLRRPWAGIKARSATGWEIFFPMESALASNAKTSNCYSRGRREGKGLAAYVEKRPAEFKAKVSTQHSALSIQEHRKYLRTDRI